MEKFSGEINSNIFGKMQEGTDHFDPDSRIDINSKEASAFDASRYDPDSRISAVPEQAEFTEKNEGDHVRSIITRNEILENDRHPVTGVPFERKIVKLPDGEKVEGVFPKFDSKFDAQLPEDLYQKPDKIQFRECNKQLANEIDNNPKLKSSFTEEQISQIHDGVYDGTAPDGYVWHHNEEAGKMQLVSFTDHEGTGHTGGRCIWGGGQGNR